MPLWIDGLSVRVVFCVAIMFLTVAYACEANRSATIGFELRDLENQVSVLDLENAKIAARVAEDGSLASVQARLKDMNMAAVGEIKHISLGGQVAKK